MSQEDILHKLALAVDCVTDDEKRAYAKRILDASLEAMESVSGNGRDVQLLSAAQAAAGEASIVAIERTIKAVSVVLAEYLQDMSSQQSPSFLQ